MKTRTYLSVAEEDEERILEMMSLGYSKIKIATELGCNKKTLFKALQHLNIEYDYYQARKDAAIVNGLKTCSVCHVPKGKEEYYLISGYYLNKCKDCQKEEERIKYNNKVVQLNTYKSEKGCEKCGDTRPYVLDFHHRDKDLKEFTISNRMRASFDNASLQEEISKCLILCSNCHREFHYLERVKQINIDEYLAEDQKNNLHTS